MTGLLVVSMPGNEAVATSIANRLAAPIGALLPDFTIPVIVKAFSEAPLQAPHLRRTTAP